MIQNHGAALLLCARRLGSDLGEPAFTNFIRTEFVPKDGPVHDVLLRISTLPLRHLSLLLTIPRFLAAPEIAVAASNVLKAAYAESLPNKGQNEKIEKHAIERIPRSRYIKRYEKPESIQNRLLLCIGPDQLFSSVLRERAEQLSKEKPQFANEPCVRMQGGAIRYSTEDWLRDEGADTTKKENAEILEAINPLIEFEHKFLNGVPSAEDWLGSEPPTLPPLYCPLPVEGAQRRPAV